MPVGIEAWITQIPPVTRAWLLLSIATSIAVQCQLVTPLQLYFSFKAAFTNAQPWRALTTFFYFGSISLDFVFHLFFLYVLPAPPSNLLDSQAANFDVVEVLELVPPDWPLPTLSAFLARSLRRALHAKHEGLIVKGISMGQNLAISDDVHTLLREYGAVLEEALPDSEGSEVDEKAALRDQVGPGVTEIAILGAEGKEDVDVLGRGFATSYGSSMTDPRDDEEDGLS
ncbi:hypothetical protein EWM64_g4246 [Hericium alpestre]|uniref:Derlin n=1 Tax=Hericium alpestre TaxID=135208 RepID=A0A4Y9ZXZ9_9AGAM|nr:hypothetical protein EWM64_g4246 [Hericium alpestre]